MIDFRRAQVNENLAAAIGNTRLIGMLLVIPLVAIFSIHTIKASSLLLCTSYQCGGPLLDIFIDATILCINCQSCQIPSFSRVRKGLKIVNLLDQACGMFNKGV